MSNYHVMEQTENARNIQVGFHIAVPDENNAAGYSLRSAVSEYVGGATFVSDVSWLTGQEVTDLQNGVLFERVETVKFLASDNNAQKQTKIDNRYIALTTGIVSKIQTILKFWQLNRNVP